MVPEETIQQTNRTESSTRCRNAVAFSSAEGRSAEDLYHPNPRSNRRGAGPWPGASRLEDRGGSRHAAEILKAPRS